MTMAAATLSPSPFGDVYQQIVANGYIPLPISPTSKAPSLYSGGKWRPMREWQKFRTAPPSSFILRAWSMFPGCNIGILTGTRATATHMTAAVDIDTDDPDIIDEMLRALPFSPVRKRGKRGFTLFFLVPLNTVGFRTEIVELLTDTRQTLIPPSIHPDIGQPYEWTGTATLLDTPAAALPVLTEDDIARFRDTVEALTKKPIKEHRAPVEHLFAEDADQTVWQVVNAKALTMLDAWVPELGLPKLERTSMGYKGVAFWRASSTGRAISDRKPNLSITWRGAKDHGTGATYSAIDLAMEAFSLDQDAGFEWVASRVGMLEQPLAIPAVEPPAEPPPVEAQATIPPEEIPDMGIPMSEPSSELPEALTRVPGILGEVIEWIVDGAMRPNRALALGAAVTILGTAIGGAVAGPTGSASNLYVVALAPSGAGKDHPLKAISKLLKASSMGGMIGPSEFMSMSAVIKYLQRKPVSVCAMDEFGAFLKRITHPRSSVHEKAISKILRTAWGANFSTMSTPEWASLAATEIDNPSLSIYGVSTPAEFFSALEGDDVVNGFLNRWLIVTTDRRSKEVEPRHPAGHVPPELALKLVNLRNEANRLTADDRSAPIGDSRAPRQMVWNGGRLVYEALLADVARISRDEEAAPYYARTGEIAVRLAAIRAAGRGLMQITEEDMAWGRDVAMWSAGRMAALAGSYIAENDTQRLHNRVIRIIAAKGGRMSHRDLVRALKGAVTSRGLKDIMDQMLTSGGLVAHKTIPPAGGPPSVVYELRTA